MQAVQISRRIFARFSLSLPPALPTAEARQLQRLLTRVTIIRFALND